MLYHNSLGQPIGFPVPNWNPPPAPKPMTLTGRYAKLEPLGLSHLEDLWQAFSADVEDRVWTYMPEGPYANPDALAAQIEKHAASRDPLFFTLLVEGRALGWLSLMRIKPAAGAIEVGWVTFSRQVQGTPATTEAHYLLMQWAFGSGYRRYEWKCDALNAPSQAAARRLGFTYEGTFRQAVVYKSRNRDTDWFSILDSEWESLGPVYETWLSPDNFDAEGKQKQRFSDLTQAWRERRS